MANGVLVAVGDNKIVYGVDPATGLKLWDSLLPQRSIHQPVVCDKFVVVELSDNSLMAIDNKTGQPAWHDDSGSPLPLKIPDGLIGQIAADNNTVYYFTNLYEMRAMSPVTQQDVWQQPVKFTQLSPFAKPVLSGGMIYVTSGSFLVAITASSGSAVWQTNTNFNQISYDPAVCSSGVFVVSDDGDVMLYDTGSGQPTSLMHTAVNLGSYPVADPIAVDTPAIDSRGDKVTMPKLIVPTSNGAVNEFDPSSQAVDWSYIVKPIDENAQPTQARGKFGGGGGGFGGGGARGGFGGGGGGGGAQSQPTGPIEDIQASGPGVVAGSTLIVPEQDSSLIAFDTTLGVDLTPPNVRMLFPNPGDQVSGQPPLLLYFKLQDWGSGINDATLKFSIDGKPYEFTYKRNGDMIVLFSNEGKNRPLQDGRHEILVDVKDWMGNEAQHHFALMIDNSLPPIVLPGTKTGPTIGGGKLPGGIGTGAGATGATGANNNDGNTGNVGDEGNGGGDNGGGDNGGGSNDNGGGNH
jgi:uncharacterized membrane protein YgcG